MNQMPITPTDTAIKAKFKLYLGCTIYSLMFYLSQLNEFGWSIYSFTHSLTDICQVVQGMEDTKMNKRLHFKSTIFKEFGAQKGMTHLVGWDISVPPPPAALSSLVLPRLWSEKGSFGTVTETDTLGIKIRMFSAGVQPSQFGFQMFFSQVSPRGWLPFASSSSL